MRQLLSIDTRHCVKFGDDLFARDYFMNDSRIRLGAHVVELQCMLTDTE